MISSEVQRTLVKSPPELWAELSDPAALARHLGEFGEIRITRIDPEQAVEWEAEDASGKVQIKPSAWGTRVTLTVTRQMPQPDAPAASEPPAQSEETTEAEPRPTDQADVDAATQTEADPTVGAQAEPRAQGEPETTAHAWPEPAAHAEPDPVPAVKAEPDAAAQTEAGPWVVHLAEEPPDALTATAVTLGSGTEPEVEPKVDPTVEPIAEPDAELLPRRGFFSRLFGRHRRRAASELDPSDTSASASSPSEPPVAIAGVEPQPTESGETTPTWESQFGSPVTAAGLQWHPQPEETAAGLESQRPRHIETDAGGQSPPAEPPATDATVEQPQPAPADAVAEHIDEPAASVDAEPQDLSEGLKAAEEAAAEETAVALTAVLDRLGAAHHRPFSRG